MSSPVVRCPACNSRVDASSAEAGRYWCTTCDEVFELHEIPDEPADAAPLLVNRYSKGRARPVSDERGSGRGLVLALVALCVLGLVGLSVAGYFAFKKDPPKETVANDPPPAPPERKLPKPPDTPKKEEPKKAEPHPPKSPTPEEIVRRVKGATVYVRATIGPGRVDMGSGFFAGKPGFVVTNAHVVGYGPRDVRPPRKVEVVAASGEADERTLSAKVYGVDVESDLALLQVEGDDLPAPLSFGKATELVETQDVVIYGYPFGELLGKNISVNRSTVSSLRKEGGTLKVIQLAGGLNPGNSGGPVTNTKGEIIGVSVAKLRGTDSIAFAIPAEEADSFVKYQHRAGGRFDGQTVAGGLNPVIPPVKPIPIAPADVGVAGTEVKLAAEGSEVCVGGGGRFLIVNLPKVKQIAVFDASQAKVVKHLPAPAEKVLLAAGMDKLIVVDPDTNVVQRWSLTTFEKEVTASLPTTPKLVAFAAVMGSASNGPLMIQAVDYPNLGEGFLFDITTMKDVRGSRSHDGRIGYLSSNRLRASPDGRLVTVTSKDGLTVLLSLHATGWTEHAAPWRERGQPALPSADGNTVYGPGEIVSPTGKRIAEVPGRGNGVWYLPALHGPLVLVVTEKVEAEGRKRTVSMAVHAPRDKRPLFLLPRFEATDSLFEPNVGWSIDGHVFFIPQAKVVAVFPKAKDRVVLYKVDVDAELAKTELDYLFAASYPELVVPGKKFEYQIDTKSKKGGVKYKLDFGPDGLAVGAEGKITWDVPAAFAKPVSVAVTITDKIGQEAIHTFELTPAGTK